MIAFMLRHSGIDGVLRADKSSSGLGVVITSKYIREKASVGVILEILC